MQLRSSFGLQGCGEVRNFQVDSSPILPSSKMESCIVEGAEQVRHPPFYPSSELVNSAPLSSMHLRFLSNLNVNSHSEAIVRLHMAKCVYLLASSRRTAVLLTRLDSPLARRQRIFEAGCSSTQGESCHGFMIDGGRYCIAHPVHR